MKLIYIIMAFFILLAVWLVWKEQKEHENTIRGHFSNIRRTWKRNPIDEDNLKEH